MRNLYILIAVALIMNTGYTQVPSNCVASLNLKNTYEIDVADLAIGRMFDIKSADTNQITIPQSYQDTVWHGLAAIFNAFTITERDSVFDIYCIHNYSYKTLSLFHHIYVGVDLNYLWTKQWKNLITTTYYQELDDLLSKYGFTIYHFSTLYTPSAALYTDKNINVAALCDSLLLLNGIIFAGPLNTHSDGNRVKYAKIGDDQFFDFTLAWGDCHSGCINKLKWKFKVNYPNCIVFYLGSDMYFGYPLPNPIDCNITTSLLPIDSNANSIMIYPNPTTGFIIIDAQNIKKIEVLNILGQVVKKNENIYLNNRIDLNNQPPGIYFVKVETDLKTVIQKIIKE